MQKGQRQRRIFIAIHLLEVTQVISKADKWTDRRTCVRMAV
jgi:hypothetical protein